MYCFLDSFLKQDCILNFALGYNEYTRNLMEHLQLWCDPNYNTRFLDICSQLYK